MADSGRLDHHKQVFPTEDLFKVAQISHFDLKGKTWMTLYETLVYVE